MRHTEKLEGKNAERHKNSALGQYLTYSRSEPHDLLPQGKVGTFPKRIQINSGSVGWLENEVEVWLADRIPEWGQLAGCQIELSQLAGGQLD